jgi:hypothetical protein
MTPSCASQVGWRDEHNSADELQTQAKEDQEDYWSGASDSVNILYALVFSCTTHLLLIELTS